MWLNPILDVWIKNHWSLLPVLFICFCKSSYIYSKMKVFTFEWSSHPGLLTFKGYHFHILWCDSVSFKSSNPEVFLEKVFLVWFNKFTVEHPCQSVISIKLQSNFIEITLRHGCSPVNLLHVFRTRFEIFGVLKSHFGMVAIFRTPFPGWLLLELV